MVGHNVNKQRNHIMNENKPKVATWVLCVDIDPDNNPEYDPMFVAALDMPLDGGLIGVTLPGNRLGKATALAARTAFQANDKVVYGFATKLLTGELMDIKANYSKDAK